LKADLHFHSRYSDGALWPIELAALAYKKGLEIVALTDHDTFEGVNDFMKATSEIGIIGIPAIEIDFVDNQFGFKSEILGYFPDGKFHNTLNYILQFQSMRRKIAEISLIKAKSEFGADGLSIEDLIKDKIGDDTPEHVYDKISLTKHDIFNYFTSKNITHNFEKYEDFKNYFFSDKEFESLSRKPEFKKCIECINKDGGYAVLAHPAYQFSKDPVKINENLIGYKKNLQRAKEIGLWGLEMHSYDCKEDTNLLNSIFHKAAFDCDLKITFGSDFHAANTENNRELGCVIGDFQGFSR